MRLGKHDKSADQIEVKILANPEQSVTTTLSWQQHMKRAIRSVDQLLSAVGLDPDRMELPEEARKFPVFAPVPFVERMNKRDRKDPLLRQVLPVHAEGHSPVHFSIDPLREGDSTIQDGLIQKYQKRVLVIASAACAINCRYCFRRHFPYETAALGASRWDQIIQSIQDDTNINEVILSGGDPLTIADESFADIFYRLARIDHVQRVRIHSRLPIVIPQRVTDLLIESLWSFRRSRIGRQVVFVVHSNHANELDESVRDSLRIIHQSVTQVLNQTVLLAGVNDDAETLVNLSERLLSANVMPYYLHQLDPVKGVAHFEVPIDRGIQLINAIRARLPGYAVPRYVQEIAGEPNKTVLA